MDEPSQGHFYSRSWFYLALETSSYLRLYLGESGREVFYAILYVTRHFVVDFLAIRIDARHEVQNRIRHGHLAIPAHSVHFYFT